MKINSININNKYNANNAKGKNSVAFKGSDLTGVSKLLAEKVYPTVANSKPYQKVVTSLSHTDKSFTGLLVAESILLSGFYMFNTVRNKKIKKEQKPQMLINDAMTLGVSTAGALFLDDKISNMVTKGTEKYIANRTDFYKQLGEKNVKTHINDFMTQVGEAVNKTGKGLEEGAATAAATLGEHLKTLVVKEGKTPKTFQITKDKLEQAQNAIQEAIKTKPAHEAKEAVGAKVKDLYANLAGRIEADKFEAGMRKVKTLIIFGIIYRYMGPVIVTPLANKLSSKFFGKKETENKK